MLGRTGCLSRNEIGVDYPPEQRAHHKKRQRDGGEKKQHDALGVLFGGTGKIGVLGHMPSLPLLFAPGCGRRRTKLPPLAGGREPLILDIHSIPKFAFKCIRARFLSVLLLKIPYAV